ncbi:MAG: N-acetylmuramoyl-L-alanine amidase [Bernardetiaceae bacterium]|nr:N-acetylmuramoyl-L-alanine amidase [Bernardetiaceae bacterium]
MKRNIQIKCSAVAIILLLFCFSTGLRMRDDPREANKIKVVVIDAGHGGKDPGTLGKHSQEKDVVLAIALELGKLIEENIPGVEVVYTRKTDIFLPLDERADIANHPFKNDRNRKADLFISIHANASKNKEVTGTETYVLGMHRSQDNLDVAIRENSVIKQEADYKKRYNFDPESAVSYIKFANTQNYNISKSLSLAEKIEWQFKNRAKRNSRGVKQSGFLVLWKTTVPSVLIEVGFLSNENEEKYLNVSWGRSHIASAIYRAFKEYKKEMEAQ